jgi:hypothetical protein
MAVQRADLTAELRAGDWDEHLAGCLAAGKVVKTAGQMVVQKAVVTVARKVAKKADYWAD